MGWEGIDRCKYIKAVDKVCVAHDQLMYMCCFLYMFLTPESSQRSM